MYVLFGKTESCRLELLHIGVAAQKKLVSEMLAAAKERWLSVIMVG